MSVPKANNAQRDFSGGEADAWIKRADDMPQHKSVARQMSNWRPLTSRGISNRPGRRIIGQARGRVDEVIMSSGQNFSLGFSGGSLKVYNTAFATVFDSATQGAAIAWGSADVGSIVWDIYRFSIYITWGGGTIPWVLTWDGVSQTSTWTLIPFFETISAGNQKRTPFYRISPPGVTLRPAAITGSNVLLQFSAGMNLVAGHVGTRIRFINCQILITSVTDSITAHGTIEEVLPWASNFGGPGQSNFSQSFSFGDEIIGKDSGAKAVVANIAADGLTMVIQHLSHTSFNGGELLVGPNGSTTFTTSDGVQNPAASTIWDDEVMNGFRGYPRSCFVDQGRLGLCDFPALPGFIVWSGVGTFTDLYTDENNVGPTNSIQELAPGKSRVLYVVPGADGSEFVFCDNACHYIPINQSNPLKPGSVAFNTLMSEGINPVQPRPVQASIVFVSAGGTQVKAVQAIGAYNRPYIVDDISGLHSHLLNNPIAIAAPGGSDQFEESYFYICNSDGSLVLSSFNIQNGIIDTKTMGWMPWTGNTGFANWISALKGHSDVIITGTYNPNNIFSVPVVEQVDATQYLDAAMLYNSVPTSLTPPGGKGPLWWIAGGSVDLMDGLRMMGTYQIDANGFLVPQNNAGENFASATLTVGQAWTAILEPFVPSVQPGQDVQQRLRKRRVARFEVYVHNSSGFTMCRIAGAPKKRLDPPAGTVMQRRRIEAWNQDDDPTLAPPLREQAYSARPIGRFHDPRVAIIKDTPGPLTILELGLEVTV